MGDGTPETGLMIPLQHWMLPSFAIASLWSGRDQRRRPSRSISLA